MVGAREARRLVVAKAGLGAVNQDLDGSSAVANHCSGSCDSSSGVHPVGRQNLDSRRNRIGGPLSFPLVPGVALSLWGRRWGTGKSLRLGSQGPAQRSHRMLGPGARTRPDDQLNETSKSQDEQARADGKCTVGEREISFVPTS